MRATSSAPRTPGAVRLRARGSTARDWFGSSTAASASGYRTRAGPTSRTAAASCAGPSGPAISSSSTAPATSASMPVTAASSTRRTRERVFASRRWVRTRATTAPGASALPSFLAHLLGHGGEHLPGDRRVALDERPELPRRHAVADHVGAGRQGRGAGRVVEERDLAEVVAGPDRSLRIAADGHFRLALLDDEEAGAAGPLLRQGVALAEAALPHAAGNLAELAVVEPREQRHLLQRVGRDAHGRIYIVRRFPVRTRTLAARISGCKFR